MFDLDNIELESLIKIDSKKPIEKQTYGKKKKDYAQGLNLLFTKANKYKLLSVEDERYHLYKIRSNHADSDYSFSKIFNHNLKLVFAVARYYENKGVDIHDLVQEGCVGLIEAIHKFKLDKNVRFSTYATNWIRQKINKNIQEHSRTIRIPSSLNQLISKYYKYQKYLSNLFNRQATLEEVSACIDIPIKDMKEYLNKIPYVFSFDANVSDDEQPFKDFISDTKSIDSTDMDNQLDNLFDAIRKLDSINQHIVCSLTGTFGHSELTVKELSKQLKIPQDEIKSRYKYSLDKLKRFLKPY